MVYVIAKSGKPLMPCKPAKARKLLRDEKAKCIRRKPFTIKLAFDCVEETQEIVAGMDTGSKWIGTACVGNGKVLYQSEVTIRQDVSKKMEQRRMYRRSRRGRKTRYRKPRFQNRAASRREDRLAPSIRSKVEAHLREKRFVESILPVTRWKLETAKFDIHKIVNPEVFRWTYQTGRKKGFYNVKAYVLDRDGYQCQKCKAKHTRLEVHHIVFKSKGGTNEPDNLITLCHECHEAVHSGEVKITGLRSKTKHATEMGIVRAQIKKTFGSYVETFGYETKFKREGMGLPKEHYFDAVAIVCEEGQVVEFASDVVVKRNVSKGDYQQTKGRRSEKRIPTGKLFGLRKFDYIRTPKAEGFVKGKRSSGYFAISDIDGNTIHSSVNVKREYERLSARKGTIISIKEAALSSHD